MSTVRGVHYLLNTRTGTNVTRGKTVVDEETGDTDGIVHQQGDQYVSKTVSCLEEESWRQPEAPATLFVVLHKNCGQALATQHRQQKMK